MTIEGELMSDYTFDQHGGLRHKKCGGQIAVEGELWIFDGFGFPHTDEIRGCQTEPGPHATTIVRRFGGYRGYCMRCHREGNFYGRRYRRHKSHGRVVR